MKRRRPWLAALANLFALPLGHLYVGRPGRGAVAWVAYAAFAAGVMFLLGGATSAVSLAVLLAALGCATVGVVADAFVLARRAGGDYRLAWFNRWYVYLVALVVVSGTGEALRALLRREVLQAFTVPSGSMAPTLLRGDHFLTDKRAYRGADPRRLDVAVIEDPADPTRMLVRRIIGLPGDTVELRDGIVWLNGARLDEPYAVPAGRDHGSLVVPPEHYFLLNDDRGGGWDGRAWGAVPRERLVGRAHLVYWSWARDAAESRGVRWERIGMSIR